MTVTEFFERCTEIKFVASGFGSSVYRVRCRDGVVRAVKVARRSVQSSKSIEVAALKLLVNCDAVPEYLEDLSPCSNHPFGGFVLAWAEGAPMKRHFDLAILGRAIGFVHATTAKLPDIESTAIERVSPNDALMKDCLEYLDTIDLPSDVRARVLRELDHRMQAYVGAIPEHTNSCLVHTDLISDNILISENSVIFIDWEYARWSHPFWDLAHFIAPTTTLWDNPPAKPYALSDLEDLVTGYVSAFGRVSIAETMRAVSALVPLAAIQSTLWALFQLVGAKGGDLPDYERLLRYKLEDILDPNTLELAHANRP